VIRVCSVCIFVLGMGMFGVIIYLPLFMQGVLGVSATQSGTLMTPMMLGAVTGLLLVVLVAPPPPGQDSARAIDIAALLGGLFSGMLGAWAIIRRLFARVGRMPPDEVAALTKER